MRRLLSSSSSLTSATSTYQTKGSGPVGNHRLVQKYASCYLLYYYIPPAPISDYKHVYPYYRSLIMPYGHEV
jgi:hypothetical protein